MAYRDLSPEQRTRRNRQSAASRDRYNAKTYSKITLRLRQDGGDGFTLDQLKAAAEAAGQSVNGWIIDLIKGQLQ